MSLSTQLRDTAIQLLTDFGELVTASRKVEGAYDVSTGATAASTDTTYQGYGSSSQYFTREIDGEVIQLGDLILYFQTGTLPLVGDVVTFDSKAYRVMDVQSLRAQGIDVVYKLQLRI